MDGNRILSLIYAIATRFNRKRSPVTGRKLITNIPTQLLGNRYLTFNVCWRQNDGKEKRIKGDSFQPARNLESGENQKSLAGEIYTDYASGNLPAKIALREAWYVMSYFLSCILTGQLPTPSKLSGQSTIMSHVLREMMGEAGVTPQWVEITNATGVTMRVEGDRINQVLSYFYVHGDNILESWEDTKSVKSKGDRKVTWV
jgi:hypothetical protein